MGTDSNVYSQGGGGTQYEFEVQTAYFINFLIGAGLPGLPDDLVTEFRQQSGSLGYKTDDLLIKCRDENGIDKRILFQVKHNLIVSENSKEFDLVLTRMWSDFKNPTLFDQALDRIYLVKSDLTKKEKNDLKELLDWAKLKSTLSDFETETFRIDAKKKYFELFKSIILKTDNTVTNSDIFSFFKCFDIFEYDFGHSTSISKANVLSLIALTKSNDSASPLQIWDSVYSFIGKSDSKGGCFTINKMPEELRKYFDAAYYRPQIQKLKKLSLQNLEIIDVIEDTIGSVKLNRGSLVAESNVKLNECKFLILTGEAGTGKSAVAKELLKSLVKRKTGYILTFKADELISKNLRDFFVRFDIDSSISEIFSHFPLDEQNIIYVDSAEKLLEGEGIGFKQLLSFVNGNANVKLIISCRTANVQLIERKYFFNTQYEIEHIPVLTDKELDQLEVDLPAIKSIRSNTRILPLIKNPKYLDFAVKALYNRPVDFTQINEAGFINRLWETIIENRTNGNLDGLPMKRGSLFIELAVKRAKKMLPFVDFDTTDYATISLLEKDGIIVKSSSHEIYAPAHDVLEDWALIRFVSNQFVRKENDRDFFEKLGTEPAMRRAYRLWMQHALKNNEEDKIKFFVSGLNNVGLDRFWVDETLVAILNAEYCQSFFESNLHLLKQDEWKFFFRVIHIMRTACRETIRNADRVIPIGYAWTPVIKIISHNIADIPKKYYILILNMLTDWRHSQYISEDIVDGTAEAGNIVLFLLNNYFLNNERVRRNDVFVKKCISLLYDYCGGIIKEVEQIIKKALASEDEENKEEDWDLKDFHEEVIEQLLSNLTVGNLAKYLPDLLISIAKTKWYRKPKKLVKLDSDLYGDRLPLIEMLANIPEGDMTDIEFHFGLSKQGTGNYFPASAWQTPILSLLRHHTFKTLDFIIELINHCTEKYAVSDYAKDDGCVKVELILWDGTKITQTGSVVLWSIYRGNGKVTSYLLQSVLMALEYYLLEIAGKGETTRTLLHDILDTLYRRSVSVATTGVISSVCQAYPLEVGDQLLPLFTHRSLMSWDVSRFTHDFTPLTKFLPSTTVFDNERTQSDALPHRLKHNPGIKGFIIDYCFNIRILNSKIFEILDDHRRKASSDDLEWRKILDDMDGRSWMFTKEIHHDGKIGFLVQPGYKDEIKAYVDEAIKPFEESSKNAEYKLWLINVEKEKIVASIAKWREIYTYYLSVKELRHFEYVPGLLAVVGIRNLWEYMNENEKGWAVGVTVSVAEDLLKKQKKPFDHFFDVSPYFDDAILTPLPKLLILPELQKYNRRIELLIINLLIGDFQITDPTYSKFLKAWSKEGWKTSPGKALKYFKGVIAFAKFSKSNKFYIDHPYTKSQVAAYNKKLKSITNKIYKGKISLELSEITPDEYSQWFLKKAILFIPNDDPSKECIDFLKSMVDLYISQESRGRYSGKYHDGVHEIRIALTEKISNIIFWSIDTAGNELFEYLLNKVHDPEVMAKAFKGENEIFMFFRNTVEQLILIADYNLPDDNGDQVNLTISLFQKIWYKFEKILLSQNSRLFSDLLLLNISWRDTTVSWKPIEHMADFFERNIKVFGAGNLKAVINLLSHVGNKTMMPRGINWIVDIINNTSKAESFFSYELSEKLINRIYNNHLPEIKTDRTLFHNYLWMLDEMISGGSSDAYWIREFLISFR